MALTETPSTTPHPRLSLNQATIKYAGLEEALSLTAAAGYQSIGLWREPVAEVGLQRAAQLLSSSGLRFSSLCRGGFLTEADDAAFAASLAENRRAIAETAALAEAGAAGSAPVLVLVAGGIQPGSTVHAARERFFQGLCELVPDAAAAGVTVAIEPLHPMYASDRAVISTLEQALDLAEEAESPYVGVVVDSFHIWWDPQVLAQIRRAGAAGRIASYQVCDWRTPLETDVLLSRHQPGEGVIDFAAMTRAVENTGYTGDVEVELFNQSIWDAEPALTVQQTAASFQGAVAPYLRGAGSAGGEAPLGSRPAAAAPAFTPKEPPAQPPHQSQDHI
ncbi:sugar phosphate isomerase/epimerase family protein [Nesterenkonia alkaliphila]|uniref:TIM barrel protein n=1 Tax=Nesterenkonia alkaliphila TaxID=1463631 RepID=A0A7K1UJ44_9MICC|nr:sugar phosphate isomerase/epimerase [Nesterenkonia alkaliphila]MVT26071.1 TIM barrel protein [Nesterenkonia alkaliphila]GFZ86501.1 sugar phosphate isomerase [Nesterenkonia alkaliphila]